MSPLSWLDAPGSWLLRAGSAAVFLISASGCTVTESVQIDPLAAAAAPQEAGCISDLGSYALPKAYLHVVIGQKTGEAPDIAETDAEKLSVTTVRHPDPSLVFCLDYLSSRAAHDKITIKKAPQVEGTGEDNATTINTSIGRPLWTTRAKTPFLGAVMVNASDRTRYIVETLLRSAFILASGDPNFPGPARKIGFADTKTILADLEYDPFDPEETAMVNARLSKLGFCLVLEDYTFPRRSLSVDAYCNAPQRHAAAPNRIIEAYVGAQARGADKHLPGLLYRPRVPYRMEIYRKTDPGGRGRWLLTETLPVHLENLSPVLSLDIRRAAFAGRNANFVFDQGTLINACISKGSEVEGFVDIPLQISRSILALPGSIIAVRFDQIDSQRQLVEAQSKLVQVQQAYFKALTSGTYQPVAGVALPSKPFGPPNIITPATEMTEELTAAAYAEDSKDPFNQNLAKLCAGG